MNKISVIVPIYNVEQYVERCLNSIIENTYKNLEIICINDGSTDNSLKILEKIAENEQRIKIIDKINGGVSSARNIGLDVATGDYIAFVDSDDWVHNRYFEILLDFAIKEEADIVACDYKQVFQMEVDNEFEDGMRCKVLNSQQALIRQCIRVCGKLYHKDKIQKFHFPSKINFGEDTIFNVQLMSNSEKIKVILIEEKLYYYFSREDSETHSLPPSMYLEMAKWYLQNMGEKREYYLTEVFRTLLLYRYEGMIIWGEEKIHQDSDKYVEMGLKMLKDEKNTHFIKKIYYVPFLKSPKLYRRFCILRDRSLLEWEKILKKKYSKD